MLHSLTIGHLDPAAVQRRQTLPTKALEMEVVHRILAELGEKDAAGNVTLGGCKVRFREFHRFMPVEECWHQSCR